MEFVTFEIAKKLKDKGFREKCLSYYDVEDNVGLLYNTQYTDEMLPCQYTDLLQCHNTGKAEYQIDDSGFCVDAPTISQVLKWLRVEKGIYVTVDVEREDWFEYKIVQLIKNTRCTGNHVYETYNDARLAGIEYVLDNLI